MSELQPPCTDTRMASDPQMRVADHHAGPVADMGSSKKVQGTFCYDRTDFMLYEGGYADVWKREHCGRRKSRRRSRGHKRTVAYES